jgi:mono/diheme cytochrome c family protein
MVLNIRIASLLMICWLTACESQPAVNEDGSPDAGRLYNIHCASCHKPNGTGGISGAKNLLETKLDIEGIKKVIRNGQGDMMPFSSILNDAEIEAVAQYVNGFKQ